MSKLISMARASVGWFERFEAWLAHVAGFILILMAVTTCYEVIARYAFNSPTLWSYELNINFIIYFAFLGGAYTLLTGGHVRVDVLYTRFSDRKKATMDIVTFLLALTFIAVLIWKGLEMAMYSLSVGKRSQLGMEWLLFPLQIIIPIGGLLVGLQMIVKIVRDACFVFSTRSKSKDSQS